MRFLFTLITLGMAGYGFYWYSAEQPDIKNKIEELLHSGSFHTLEIRYTAEQIMETYRKDLLKDNRHRYLESSLKFYPYLMLEVKYLASRNKTKEGVLIWDMTDGEMVLDSKNWEKTHGFGDCIAANTDRQEFKLINVLAKNGGSADRDKLTKALHIDNDVLDRWVENCRRKKLIVGSGNKYRLHLENARLKTSPSTKIEERLVTQPHRDAIRINRRFSQSQIEKITYAAFGNDFAIRATSDIYLPIHCIVVQNPDGSIHTTHWNALTGQRVQSNFID